MRGGESAVKRSLAIAEIASKEQRCSKRACISCFAVDSSDDLESFMHAHDARSGSFWVIDRVSVFHARATSFACFTTAGACPRVTARLSMHAGCVRARATRLYDPEARPRQPLRAAARAATRAFASRASLEFEAAAEATRRLLFEPRTAVREAAAQLVQRVGQHFLRDAELARQLVEALGDGPCQRLPQRLRQGESRFSFRGQGPSFSWRSVIAPIRDSGAAAPVCLWPRCPCRAARHRGVWRATCQATRARAFRHRRARWPGLS